MADRSITYTFKGNFTSLKTGLTAAGRGVKDFGGKLNALDKRGASMRQSLDQVGATAGRFGLAVGAGLAYATKQAMDWETAWAGVTKTVDATATTSLATLEQQLRDLTAELPASHEEIAGVAEAAGQLGVKADDIAGFTKTMVELGETTNLTANDAATNLARFANIMGTSTSEIDRMGSTIVDLGNNSATTEAEIVELGTRLAAAGRQAGLAESDIFAIASTLTSVGVNAEAGGTAMSKVFTSITNAVRDGNDELDTFAEVAGVSASEFQRAFEEDAAGAIGTFVDGMGKLSAEGGNTSKVFKDLGLTDQRLMRAVLSAGQATGMWADQLNRAGDAWTENSALSKEAQKRFETSASQVKIALNNVNDAAIDFGAVVLPVFAKGAAAAGDLAHAVGGLPQPIKSALSGLTGLAALLGGGIWATSKIVSGFANTRESLEGLGLSAGKASKAMKGLGLALAAVAIGNAANSFADDIFNLRLNLKDLDRDLEALSERDDWGDNTQLLVDNLNDVNDVLNKVDAGEVITLFGALGDTSLDKAQQNIDQLDDKLASLVETGEQAKAADIFDKIIGEVEPGKVDKAKSMFDSYQTAIDNAADAQDDSAGATDKASGAIDGNTEATKDNAAAKREQTKATISAFDAETQWGSALASAREAAKKGARGLNALTEAGRENRTQLSGLAGAWNNQSEAVKNTEGRYKAARKQLIEVAVQMGASKKRARGLADEMLDVPDIEPKADLDDKPAKKKLGALGLIMSNLESDPADIKANANTSAAENALNWASRDRTSVIYSSYRGPTPSERKQHRGLTRAEGGYISGPGTGTSDSIRAWLSNGEYVLPAKAVEHYGISLLEDMRAMRFAQGGLATTSRANERRTSVAASTSSRQTITVSPASLDGMRIEGAVTVNGMEGFMRGIARDEQRLKRQGDRIHRGAGVR